MDDIGEPVYADAPLPLILGYATSDCGPETVPAFYLKGRDGYERRELRPRRPIGFRSMAAENLHSHTHSDTPGGYPH